MLREIYHLNFLELGQPEIQGNGTFDSDGGAIFFCNVQSTER